MWDNSQQKKTSCILYVLIYDWGIQHTPASIENLYIQQIIKKSFNTVESVQTEYPNIVIQ